VIGLTEPVVLGLLAIVVAAIAAGIALSGHRNIARTAATVAVLTAFFAVWTAKIADHSTIGGVLLFAAAIGTFRAMNFFERPRRG
jgi:hypothetical protein